MLEFLTAALKLAPSLIAAGTELTTLASQVLGVIQAKDQPTDQDWANLDAFEVSLRNQLQAPLPAA